MVKPKKRIKTRENERSHRELALQGVIGTVLCGFKKSDRFDTKLISGV